MSTNLFPSISVIMRYDLRSNVHLTVFVPLVNSLLWHEIREAKKTFKSSFFFTSSFWEECESLIHVVVWLTCYGPRLRFAKSVLEDVLASDYFGTVQVCIVLFWDISKQVAC